MEYVTIGKTFGPGKIRKIYYNPQENFKSVQTLGERYLLVFIRQGACSVDIDGKTIILAAPCIACFNEKENIQLKQGVNMEAQSLYIHPSFVNWNLDFEKVRMKSAQDEAEKHDCFLFEPFINRKNGYNGVLHVEPAIIKRIDYLIASTGNELVNQPDWYWSCRSRSYFMELLFMLERLHMQAIDDANNMNALDIPSSPEFSDIDDILVYLRANYHCPIQIDDLVRMFGTNRTTLSKRFKTATGHSVIDYLNKYRSIIAASLLRQTNLNVSEIANRLGFNDLTHFSRIFKKYHTCAPLKFRELHWK